MTIGRTPRNLTLIEAKDYSVFLDAVVKSKDALKKFAPQNSIQTQKERELAEELAQQLIEKYDEQQKKPIPKLYFSAICPECKPVLHFCALNHIKVELHELEILTGDHLSYDFSKKSKPDEPLILPVLDDQGTIITKRDNILLYLAEKYYVPDYWIPGDADMKEQLEWAQTKIVKPLENVFWTASLYQAILFPPKTTAAVDTFVKEQLNQYCAGLKELEATLSSRKFLLGSRLSIVDVIIAEALSCEKLWEVPLYYSFRNISRWLNLLKKAYLNFWHEINYKFDGFCLVARLNLTNIARDTINTLSSPTFQMYSYFPIQTPNGLFHMLTQDNASPTEVGSEIINKNMRKTNVFLAKKVKVVQRFHLHDLPKSNTCIAQFQLLDFMVGTFCIVTFLSLPKEEALGKYYIDAVQEMVRDFKGFETCATSQSWEFVKMTSSKELYNLLLDFPKLCEMTKATCTTSLTKITLLDGAIIGEVLEVSRDKLITFKIRQPDWPESIHALMAVAIKDGDSSVRGEITYFNIPLDKSKPFESLLRKSFWTKLGGSLVSQEPNVQLQSPTSLVPRQGDFLMDATFVGSWWNTFEMNTCKNNLTWSRVHSINN